MGAATQMQYLQNHKIKDVVQFILFINFFYKTTQETSLTVFYFIGDKRFCLDIDSGLKLFRNVAHNQRRI